MFCPKCAAQNVDASSFCRTCGANISLVPQALTGRLPEAETSPLYIGYRGPRIRRGRHREPPSLERGIVSLCIGIGFILAALAVMTRIPDGVFWGWALFLPGFASLGKGIAAIVASQKSTATLSPIVNSNLLGSEPAPPPIMTARNTNEMPPAPPSVTEGTTRHLGTEAPTRQGDS